MSSVEDVHAAASSAETPLEEAQQQAAASSQQTGETAAALEAAKDNAEQLGELTSATGYEEKAAEVEAVRAGLEGLAARTARAAERLNTEVGELARIKQEHAELLAQIRALSG